MIDERTGAVSREWYRFFYNLYYAVGGLNQGAIPVERGGTGTSQIPTDGDLLIGNGATGAYNSTQITLGAGLSKTVGHGSLTLENTGVLGPSSSTDNAIAVYNGTTGKLIKNSTVVIDPSTGSLTSGVSGGTF